MSGSPPKRHRVLMFSSFADRGRGGQESLFHLACSLDRERFRPFVVVPMDGSLSQSLEERGIDVEVLKLPRITAGHAFKIIAGLIQLASLIDQNGVDILHTDGPRNTFYAGLIGRMKRKPVVWHVRAFASDSYDRLLYLMCSKLILVANALRGRFPFCTGSRKLATIYNGVDLVRFGPEISEREAFDTEEKISELIIAFVGRIEEQKGLFNLLQACGRLKGSIPPFKVRVAGELTDRSYFERCRGFCRSEGLAGRVEYLGPIRAVEDLLRSANIFVLPSATAEAFPRTIIEAMACGNPVIVTDVGGAGEAVVNGHNGFVVPAQAPDELAEKLRLLLKDAGLRSAMGRAGRIRAENLFGIEKAVEQTVRVYEEVLRNH
jgi:glycosyltransferase involved in cell wall biosynthesis